MKKENRRFLSTIILIGAIATGCAPPMDSGVPAPTTEATSTPRCRYCERRKWHEWLPGETLMLVPGSLAATLTSLSKEEAGFTIYQTQADPVQETVYRGDVKFLGPYVVIFPPKEAIEEPIICFLTIKEWQQQNTPSPADQA